MKEVRLEGVNKSYDGQTYAIPHLDLVCPSGEMLALLGPSGCGKSTTLKMIAGIETVTEGAIYFDGVDVSDLDTASRNVAMVFEDYALYPHLSVYQNISFPLTLRRVTPDAIRKKVDHIIDLLDLTSIQHESVQQLSGGAQQRVSIGRALVREPSLIMFDEPLSHLDLEQKIQLRTEIKRLQKTARLTSVLVTHDQNEAISMADRIAVMNLGEIQQIGTPTEIYNRPANIFVASFIGEPPMNLIEATLIHDQEGTRVVLDKSGLNLSCEPLATQIDLPDRQKLILGIRPENLTLNPGPDQAYLEATVSAVEPSGDTDVVTAQTADGALVVETMAPTRACPKMPIKLGFDVSAFHYFSANDEKNLLGNNS